MSDNNTKQIWVYKFDHKEGLICKQLPSEITKYNELIAMDGNYRITLRKNEQFSTYGDVCWSELDNKDEIRALKSFLKVHNNMLADLTKRLNYEKSVIDKIVDEMSDLSDGDNGEIA